MKKRTASYSMLRPDSVYNSEMATKFINCLMWGGKKATAMRLFYGAMDQIKKRMPDLEPIDVFTQAVEHVKPTVEVRSKRVGGATYQVPMQVNKTRQRSLAIRWIVGFASDTSPASWRLSPGRPHPCGLFTFAKQFSPLLMAA
jgi:small subunit ribosomal protein S7